MTRSTWLIDATDRATPHWRWSGDGDPVVVTVRPELRRIHVLAGAILQALGKNRSLGGLGRNESEDTHLAAAWLHAHHTTDLVVDEAHRLHPVILKSLIDLAAHAHVDLWLLRRRPVSDRTHRALTRRSTGSKEFTDLAELLSSDIQHTPLQPSTPHRITAPMPTHDFHCFRAAVHQTLPACEATAALSVHDAAAATVFKRLATPSSESTDALAAIILSELTNAPDDAHLVPFIRGVQVGAFHRDLHVAVDLPVLLNSAERPTTSPRHAAEMLNAYRQPHRSITWHLAHHDIGLDTISRLPISAAAENGTTIDYGSETPVGLPALAAAALRAQLRLRRGHEPHAPLLPHTTKALAAALTLAQTDLGLATHGRLAERCSATGAARLRRLGISIRPLP